MDTATQSTEGQTEKALLAIMGIGTGLTAAVVIGLVLLALVTSWSVATLWGWFVTPLGFPALTLPGAFGLVLLSHLVFRGAPKFEDLNKKNPHAHYDLALKGIVPVLVVAQGWVVQTFLA